MVGVPRLFRAAMKGVSYLEGENISVEWRLADGRPERLPALAGELTGLEPTAMSLR